MTDRIMTHTFSINIFTSNSNTSSSSSDKMYFSVGKCFYAFEEYSC